MKRDWEWYTTENGSAPARAELQAAGLTKTEKAQLGNLMNRIASNEVLKRDVKYIKEHGLYEARLDGDRRTFRLLYAIRDDGALLVASLFTIKKSNKLPARVFKTAKARIDDWDSRHTNGSD